MSALLRIVSIDWNATPAVDQTATVRYRLWGSVGAWTLVTNAQVVNPAGVLVPAAVINGLDEGTDYEVEVKNNCTSEGIAAASKKFTTASLNDTLTFHNKMDEGTITSIRIDGGANILGAPIGVGENFPYTAPNLYGNTHLIEVTLGLAAPTKVYYKVGASEIDPEGTYHTALNGTEFEAFNNEIPAATNFYVRSASYHLKSSEYTISRGGMHSACSIGSPAGFVERTLAATNDATNAAASVEASITWTPDNAQPAVVADYVLGPAASTVPVPPLEISGTPCTDVEGEITSLTVV